MFVAGNKGLRKLVGEKIDLRKVKLYKYTSIIIFILWGGFVLNMSAIEKKKYR